MNLKEKINRLAKRLNRSEMKGYDMYLEWNWPHMLANGWYNIVWWSFDFQTSFSGDHTPMVYVSWCVCNCMILDFSYSNAYHENDDTDAHEYSYTTHKRHKVTGEVTSTTTDFH